MQYSPLLHSELTEQYYRNLIATGYSYIEFLGYLEADDGKGNIMLLYRPLRIKPQGQLSIYEMTDPLIDHLVTGTPFMSVYIEKDY